MQGSDQKIIFYASDYNQNFSHASVLKFFIFFELPIQKLTSQANNICQILFDIIYMI